MLTTTSAAMPVTLTNPGTGPLTINSITASGDFAQTNTCPSSPTTLAALGTCTINVTFAPTAVGARTGTLTFTDNARGSPQTIPLTGTGWDFQVTAPATATGKSPLTFNATMTPLGGFNQSVAFTCTGAPAGTTCTVATPITATDGKTAQSVAVDHNQDCRQHSFADSAGPHSTHFDLADCAPDSGVAVALPADESEGASRASRAGNGSCAPRHLGWLFEFEATDYRNCDDHRNLDRLCRQCEPLGYGGCNRRLAASSAKPKQKSGYFAKLC